MRGPLSELLLETMPLSEKMLLSSAYEVRCHKAQVPSFQRIPGLHGNDEAMDVPFLAASRRQPLLTYAGDKAQDLRGRQL